MCIPKKPRFAQTAVTLTAPDVPSVEIDIRSDGPWCAVRVGGRTLAQVCIVDGETWLFVWKEGQTEPAYRLRVKGKVPV